MGLGLPAPPEEELQLWLHRIPWIDEGEGVGLCRCGVGNVCVMLIRNLRALIPPPAWVWVTGTYTPNGEASSMGDSCRFVFFIRIQNVNAILNILGARSIDCLTCNRLLTELSKHSNAAVPQAFLSFQPLPLPLRSLRTQSLLTIPSRPPPSLVSMPASPASCISTRSAWACVGGWCGQH